MNILLSRFSRIFLSTIFFISSIFSSHVFAQDLELGKTLFKTNCTSCHYLGPEEKKLIGPGLNDHIFEEYSEDWLISWVRNSSEMIESGDELAVKVYEEYNKSVMTAFPHFSDDDIKSILAYIKEGPAEETITQVETGETGSKSSNNSILYIIVGFICFNIVLLVYVKNVLKDAAGIPRESFIGNAMSWLKVNPSFLVFFSILILFGGVKGCWNSLSGIGVAQNYQPEQPIAFSHKIHSGDNGIDCNYCHHTARDSKHAGIPSLNVCMNCHTYINEGTITGKEEINKIYAAIGFDPSTRTYIPNYEEQPVEWVRVHNLPDLAYFNHSQHVNVAGVECQTCHGEIEEMDEVYQYSKLTMGWCINCHRETEVDIDNPYYHDLHKNWIDKYHGEDITVDMIGGRECAKCHY